MIGNLIVAAEREERRHEGVVHAQARYSSRHVSSRLAPIIGNHDCLHEHVELELVHPSAGLLTDVVDGALEPLGLPSHLVALTVLEGAPEHRQPDDVGVTGRVSESPMTVDTDQERNVVLERAHRPDSFELVVLPVMGDLLPVEESAEDLDGFGEASFADRGRVKRLPDCLVLAEGVPCSEPDFETAATQMVEAGQLPGEMDRVVKIIVEDERADAQVGRAVGYRHQRREG